MKQDLNQYLVREYEKLDSGMEQREFVEKVRFLMMAKDREFSAYYSNACLTGREFYSVADTLYELNNFWMLSGFLYKNRQQLFQEAREDKKTQGKRDFMELCNFGKDTIFSRMFHVMENFQMSGNMINEPEDYAITTRRIKAYAATTSKGKMIPQIVLQGNWVEQCGFEAGCSVRVECYPNKLVILKE